MTCKCGKECSGAAFAPKSQDWEYETPRSPYLLYEVCEHDTVTVDNRPKVPDVVMAPPIQEAEIMRQDAMADTRKGRRER